VAEVEVDWRGVVGDRQASRTHHGRPWQALCLWSTEVIAGFRSEGHPIAPGLAGENVTVTGLPWAEVRPGVRLRVGEVLCCVSSYAIPCKQNTGWFKDGDFMVMHHDRGPVSRVYATVLEPGRIRVGDAAVLEP
jgi:MOSC domain-containing protein YiiM